METMATMPKIIPVLATGLFPANLLPAVSTLLAAGPNSATLLPFSIPAQQPADLVPTITSVSAALIPDTLPSDQEWALPSDGATPWWVVTESLEPHGQS